MENQREEGWEISIPKFKAQSVLLVLVVGGFLVNQFLLMRLKSQSAGPQIPVLKTSATTSSSLTAFDQTIVGEMRGQGKPAFIRGSVHNHADFKVYVNGQASDFSKPEYFMKSSFLHVDDNRNKEDSAGVLHMHAKNVPLWLFFRSLGMTLEKESLTLADGQTLQNENGNSLKFYLNGKKVDELGEYVFQPLDKLLISYGPENVAGIERQISAVTNFAKDHQK